MTDELRAKFEATFPHLDFSADKYGNYYSQRTLDHLYGYQGGHASRDADVEALKRDAEIGRYVLKHAEWIRDEDDTFMAIRFAGHVDLSSVGARRDAIDTAMTKESGE